MRVKCDHVLECEIDLFFSDVLGFGGGNDRGFTSSDAISGLGAISWCNRFPPGERSSNGEEWTHCDVRSSVLVWGCVNSSNSKSSPNSFSKNASSKTLSLALSLPFCPLLRLPSLFQTALSLVAEFFLFLRLMFCVQVPFPPLGVCIELLLLAAFASASACNLAMALLVLETDE